MKRISVCSAKQPDWADGSSSVLWPEEDVSAAQAAQTTSLYVDVDHGTNERWLGTRCLLEPSASTLLPLVVSANSLLALGKERKH